MTPCCCVGRLAVAVLRHPRPKNTNAATVTTISGTRSSTNTRPARSSGLRQHLIGTINPARGRTWSRNARVAARVRQRSGRWRGVVTASREQPRSLPAGGGGAGGGGGGGPQGGGAGGGRAAGGGG